MSSSGFDFFVGNMTMYINKLPLSSVKFMYFNATDLQNPKIQEKFKTFTIGNDSYYICNGNQSMNGRYARFWYVYKQSHIKYLFTQNSLIRNNASGNIHHGDHVDFSLLRLRNSDTVIKTHKTTYTELAPNVFARTAPECNFLHSTLDTSSLVNFTNSTKCIRLDNTICGTLKQQHKAEDIEVIYHLLQVMQTTHGGRKSRKKQSGGDIFETEFKTFLYNNLLKNRENILEVRVMEDNTESNIVVLIDYEGHLREIYYIDKGLKKISACNV
jgi:hypothetical protein